MKTRFFTKILPVLLFLIAVTGSSLAISAQPLPPPGGNPPAFNQPGPPDPGDNPPPPPGAPGAMVPPPGPPSPAPTPPPGWGAPGYLVNPPSGDWMNQGTLNVMATGYDTESVLVQIPLYVSYTFNGVNYDITVLNSWNPYSQMWNMGVDVPAYQTSYYFNGFTYNYYVNLPSGTFYFNL